MNHPLKLFVFDAEVLTFPNFVTSEGLAPKTKKYSITHARAA